MKSNRREFGKWSAALAAGIGKWEKRLMRILVSCPAVVLGFSSMAAVAHHHPAHAPVAQSKVTSAATKAKPASIPGIGGQGKMRFKVLQTADLLPEEAKKVLVSAHGGFAVDHRKGRGETYFALPGAGILQISADLKTIRLVNTPPEVKNVNLHNTTVWYSKGKPYLTLPANDAGLVFTTTLDGALVHTLNAPTAESHFKEPAVNEYFRGQGKFAPTDVDHLDGLLYVATGYSKLDYVLTAKILGTIPFKALWHDLAFGGKGNGPAQFGTGHGITVPPRLKRVDVSDRPNSEIDRFTADGRFLSTLKLPQGSFPCDIDYLDQYAVVACLHGPDRSKGAPIYILERDKIISTIMPKEELGLEKFQHVHNAVLRKIGNRFYIIAQAWNPGDFAILEQATE